MRQSPQRIDEGGSYENRSGERLGDFLVGRLGGPPRSIEQRGHPRLRARHMPFALNGAAEATEVLLGFFGPMATFLMNRGE
ncbi:MAG: hypothetical protein ABIR70_16970 [Bryobacteraceae bacterium]